MLLWHHGLEALVHLDLPARHLHDLITAEPYDGHDRGILIRGMMTMGPGDGHDKELQDMML